MDSNKTTEPDNNRSIKDTVASGLHNVIIDVQQIADEGNPELEDSPTLEGTSFAQHEELPKKSRKLNRKKFLKRIQDMAEPYL